MTTNRFVIRKSLIGKNIVITFMNKHGIKVEYNPITGCTGWKFREQLNDELSKKRKTRQNDGKHNMARF